MRKEKANSEILEIFDEIDTPVYVVDPETYEILYVNRAIKKVFKKKLIGKKCYQTLQNLDKPCPFCTNKYIFGENLGKTYIWDFQNRHNGRWYHCIDRAIKWYDGRYVRFEIAIDITDRKRFEERLTILHKFSQRLHMAKTFEDIYSLTLNAIKETLGFEYASILISDGKYLRVVAQIGHPESLGRKLPIQGEKGITVKAVRTGRTIVVPDVTKEPTYIKSLPEIRSELSVPIKIGKKVLGVLNIESKKLNAFDKQDVELIEVLAAHAAVAINGLKEKEKAKKKSKQLTALMKSTTEIVSAKNLRSRLKVIAKAIKSLGWRRVVISVRDENLEIVDLVTVGLTREEQKLLWERRAPGHVWRERLGPKFHRYRIGEFFYLPWNDPWVREHVHGIPPDVPPDKADFVAGVPSRLSPDEMVDWHPQDMLYAPLRTPDGKIVGIVSVDDPIDGRKPTHESLSPLEIFLHIAAVAIENAKLIEELEKARKELKEYAEKLELKVQERTKELKKSQERLLRAERLAAIGQLAGQVGHDLRNPLTGILGAVYYLKKTNPNLDEKCRKMLEIIEKDAKYANKIIEDLLEFSREYVHLNLKLTSIRELVENALTKVTVPNNIKIVNLTSSKHKVKIDPDRILRVFVNLITNAIDAMPNGGTLRIWSRISDGYVKVFFKDSGTGIPEENLDKIWGPLFTTKAKGMGLGLSICKRIVEAHGGKITVKSKVGAGTTFTVIIPLKPKLKEKGGEKIWANPPESLLSTTMKA